MASSSRSSARAGTTDKVSVSIDRADLAVLRKRARRLYRGNLSAVVAEGIRRIREEEGREALVAWLGDAGEASTEERNLLRAEWKDETRPRRTRRARS
jgi:hypothetical protein